MLSVLVDARAEIVEINPPVQRLVFGLKVERAAEPLHGLLRLEARQELGNETGCSGVDLGAEVLELADGCAQGPVHAGVEHALGGGVTGGGGPLDTFGGCGAWQVI